MYRKLRILPNKSPPYCGRVESFDFSIRTFVHPDFNGMEKKMEGNEKSEVRLYRDQLMTIGDFLDLKDQLLTELKRLIKAPGSYSGQKWLKALEVRQLLKISAGKLQYLRNRGQIPFKKLGGVTYYDSEKIEKMMDNDG